MLVHYYEVHGCICDNVDNHPVLVAPPGTRNDLLTRYRFVMLEDGRWCHFLTQPEYDHIMTGYPDHDVIFSNNPAPAQKEDDQATIKAGNRCALIAFILFGAAIVISFIGNIILTVLMKGAEPTTDTMDYETTTPAVQMLSLIINSATSLTELGAFIMMIYTRIKYPKNTLGKVLMWIYIVIGILIAIGSVILMIACVACLNDLKNCPG